MNKLLLFAASLFCLNLEGFAIGNPFQGGDQTVSFNDTLKKTATPTDPKAGFKDLFENTSNNSAEGAQLNPKAIAFVQDYMEAEGSRLNKMKGWGKPFFDKIDAIFIANKLPVELKYLAVIESDLKTSATSRVGAAGPWQFMAATAKGLGLRVSRANDERRDFNKSTKAAAKYLNTLYNLYGDWLLVIAAYNGGPGNVNSAIRKSGSRNFWDLQYHLPAESRNHVKKFIATHYIMEGEAGLTTLTKSETEALRAANGADVIIDDSYATLAITGKYHSAVIAQTLGIGLNEFNKMNPDFDRQLSANGKYELRLPEDKMSSFQTNKSLILEQSVRLMVSAVSR